MINPQEISKIIEQRIREVISDNSDNTPGMVDPRKYAKELNILPVILDMGGLFGLRPNGEVVSVVWDDLSSLKVERDERICNIVLFSASQKFVGLESLLPTRSDKAITCTHCNGTGQLQPPYDFVVCYCGGLGWFPS
jgi:hypothetical protein